MSAIQYKSFRFSVKADNVKDDGTFEGYASVFGEKDLGGDIVLPGAFDDWLKTWDPQSTPLPILWQHKYDMVVGAYTQIGPDQKGLRVKGQINMETRDGRDKHALVKQPAVNGLSIGYWIEEGGIRYDSDNDAWLLSKLGLFEISLVTFPMNVSARVSAVKAAIDRGKGVTVRELERAARELGFSQSESKVIAKQASETLAARSGEAHREGDGIDEAALLEKLKGKFPRKRSA